MTRRRLTVVSAATAALTLATATPAWAQSGLDAASGSLMLLVGAVAAGVAAFLLIIILFGKAASSRTAQVRGRLGPIAGEEAAGGLFGRFRLLRRAASRAEGVAESRGALGMIETALEQANLPIRPGEAIVGTIGFALVLGLVIGALAQNPWWGLATAVLVLVVGVVAVNTVASRQRKRFGAQLPDTLNLIATSLRAGYSLLQAVEAVGQEAPEPTRREFGRSMSEIRLGRSVTDALQEIAVRMESQDFDWAVLAISIQREVGGNLAEVLQTTAETMLHRNRLRREMKALTAEGRISAIVLGALPFFLFGIISVVNRGYMRPLITTAGGIAALVGSLFLILVGIFWLSRIVKVEV